MKIKKITTKWLKKLDACSEGVEAFDKRNLSTPVDCINECIKINKLDWANWLIVRCMDYKQYVSYAVYAAEQVIDIYEKKYPADKRLRLAIEVAKRCIKNPTVKNKNDAHAAYAADAAYADADHAAYAAAYAAADAADAAHAAADAADAAAHAAADAAHAAYAAADAAHAAYAAAYDAAAHAAADATHAAGVVSAKKEMMLKILHYGMGLLKNE